MHAYTTVHIQHPSDVSAHPCCLRAQEVEALTAAQRSMALEADARLNELLAVQRAEYEGAVARHLAFVDRLLADKEALTARTEQLEAAVKVRQGLQGWAGEWVGSVHAVFIGDWQVQQ